MEDTIDAETDLERSFSGIDMDVRGVHVVRVFYKAIDKINNRKVSAALQLCFNHCFAL
jgi:hypothetical protein